jgi:hypothetical protein
MHYMKTLFASIAMLAPAAAFAQGAPDPDPDAHTPQSTAPPTPSGQLPPAQSDNDPAPPVPTPNIPGITADVVQQAGVGGSVGYARAGVLELGGAAGLTIAQDIRAMNLSPSIGWFLVDNLQLSLIGDVTYLKAGDSDATMWSALLEPSFHLPFNRSMFGMLGVGVGAAYTTEVGAGLAVAPRIGMDFLVGRSGILRPSLSYTYTTHDVDSSIDPEGNQRVTLVAISSSLRFNVGYSTMW